MSNKNCTYTFLDGQGQKQTIVGLSSMKAFLVDGGLDLLYPGGKFPWLSTESAIDLIRPSALQAITPDQAGNMRAGDVAVDDQGREYMVLHARHKWLEVAPIVDGRPQVSADTTIKFHLEPETKHLYRERRGDPIYATGRNRYNQEAAAESRPAAEPSPSSDQFAGLIAIAADSIESLRRSDVDRVITEAPTELKQQLAAHIKAKRPDLAGEVDGVMAEASESKPVEQADIPKLNQAEAAKLMEWQSLGQKDGVKTHILTFYESQANKDAKRGRMTMATVTNGDRSSDKWSIDGDDQSFTYLAAAKKRGMEVGMAKAVKDGFVDGDSSAGGAEVNSRDAFTLQRMNDATGQMEPVTFKRGETIKIAAGQRPYQTGVITGISQAERKFKVDGLDLAHDFGYAYKADFDESARPKGEVDAELDKLEKRLNDGIAIQADGFIRTAKDVIERNSLGDYAKGRIAQLEKKASEVSGNALEKMRAETMEREAKEAKERTDAQAKVSEPKPAIDMTMDEWKAISKDFKGNIDGQRMVMRDGGMRPVNIVKPKAAAADQPASTTPATDAHVAIMDAVREGKATPEQFKAGFEAFVANKAAILAELDAKTKVQLLRAGGPYIQMRHASDKKADVVDAIYRQMLGEYVLGESVTYGMGKDSYLNAVRQMVEATDADKLAGYVQERNAALGEAKARREAKAAAIDNPKTLDDFRNAVGAKMREGMSNKEAFLSLTPEQRIQYDMLAAESTKEARESRKRSMAARVSAAGQTTGGQIIATKHTRDGYDLFVAQLADRLSSEDYKTMLASAKRLGGWYSSFRGNGATPGFQFKDRAVAEAFLKLAGGDTTAATEQIEQRRDTFEDDRSQTAVERLRSMADKLEGQANEEEGRDRKANTARRARFASAALASAAADKAKAKTMRNIAQAIEDGKAKFLDGVRTKSQVDMLTSIVETAKANELRAKYPNYADQEKRKGEPPTAEMADFAEFPNYSAFRSDLATLGRQLLEVEGTKKLGQRLMSVADDVTDAYLEFAKDNLLKVSQFGRGDSMADFSNKDDAERALKRSGLTGKAIVLQVKRGQNRVILSPGEAIGRGIWTGDGDKRITLTAEFGNELVEAIGRRGNKSNRLTVPWQFQNAYDRRKALTRIGIETASEYRSALREFIALKEQATANKVRELELQMVGRKKDGLDFFPTSADVADQMIEAADLSPDMAVLEPSAGMGHLADRIRAAGAEPDVIEISPDRRELLEEKGYHLAEVDDFMIMEPRKFFTSGDVYRAPDGTEGIMRGVGRMGSQRVRLEDEAGNRLGLYDRSELTGIRHRGVWSGYDRIIMNPPFSKRQDAEHVRHAYELLKPGGRIVAIMGEGVFFGQDQKAQEFREWLESIGGTSEKLPDGSFMDPSLPVNTAVNARMVVIDKPAAETPAFSRTKPKATSLSAAEASSIVSAITSRWDNAPDVVVVADMQDAAVPLRVREYDAEQRSLGAQGEPEGFWFGGKVYLVAKSMGTPSDVMRVLFHEALGHYGLRGVFGNRLDAILQQIASLRRSEVEAKAKQYGLDMSIEAQRLQAAEEVLAVMAQTNPKLGFVKRAIGAIRSWLRRTMPGLFGQMELTDAEIIRDYILPARAFVERGATGKAAGGAAFSRNDSPIRAALGELIQAEAAWDAVRQGDPKNVTLSQYMALTDRSLAAKKAATAQLAELPNDGFALQAEASGGRMLILTPSAQQPGRWQLTRFSPDGNPWGDTNFDTKQQAIREFLDEADLTTIVTGDGTAFSRSQDQTRTEAFKRWYSGDYGSTPDASSRNGATGSAIQGTSGEANGGVVGRGNDVRPAVLGSKGVGQAARISVDGGQIIFDGASGPTDPSGKPVVFYHGTKADITTFNTDHPNKKDNGWLGRGVYVASNSDAAELYAVQKRDGEAENVMPVYVAVRNPYVFSDAERSRYKNATPIGVQRLTERLKAQGYDGVVYDHGGDKGVELVAFRPEQVKSAIGNNGDFDPANPDIRFSRAMPAQDNDPEQVMAAAGSTASGFSGLTSKAVDALNDHFGGYPGKLSWWHKTVGSMYNLAERSPAFKRVFDAAQSFINDVSYYGTEAASQAPKILPKLETWRDLAKTPISAEDNKALASPIFEGTLSWARDGAGNPVQVSELESRYADLTAEQKSQMLLRKGLVHEESLKAWKASPLDIFDAAVENRFRQEFLTPGIVWTPAELKSIFGLSGERQEDGSYDGQIGLYQEFRAATDLSLDNMAKADMLRYGGKDVAELKDSVMAAPSLDAAAEILRSTFMDLSKEDPGRSDELVDFANGIMDRSDKANKLKRQGYAPLSRFGQYSVDVVVDGERQYFSLFESERDAKKMAKAMIEQYGAESVSQGTISEEEFKLFQGVTPETLELFGNALGLGSTGNEAQDQVFQAYLKLTKNNRSAMKRLMHRKGVAGYSEDVGRVLAAFVYSNARQTSAALHIGELGESVDAIPKGQGQLKDEAIQLSQYIKEPREEAHHLRGFLFAQYLGGSIASAMVNFTQPLTISIPYLSQFGGLGKATAAWSRAMKDMSTGTELEPDLARALKVAEEQGVVSPQEVHQLMAQARGMSTLNSGDGTKIGDARAIAGNNLAKLALGWGKLFGFAEQVNRRSTFIAAYRLAIENQASNPSAFATKAVDETQFINNKANKMRWGRGPIGATLMTFKSYSISWLELVHRLATQNGTEGKWAAAYMVGALLLMAGAGGLPFADDIDDVIDGLAQRLGYNLSTKKAKQEFLEDIFGKAGAGFILRGITGIPGAPVDIAGRMGMGNLIPGTGIFVEKRDYTRDVMEVAGPAGDFITRVGQGLNELSRGNLKEAALAVAPKAVSNAVKGADMLGTGMYRDTKGRKVIDTSTSEAISKLIGFQPASVSNVQEAAYLGQRAKDFYALRKQEISAQWANGIFEKDPEQIAKAREAFREWNASNPGQRMAPDMPGIARRVREMRKNKLQRIADTSPKGMREMLRQDFSGVQ